ncbi:MAG: hypothetical protein ACRBK7_08985 [Acidimicrobiales bacterium]
MTAVPRAYTLDEALGHTVGYWSPFDVIVVDVLDEVKQAKEVGTDVYSGVSLIESMRRHQVRATIVAITPTRTDPLLWERLVRSGADYVYERVDFQQSTDLVEAVMRPHDRFRPVSYPKWLLSQQGLGEGADPNRAVAIFKDSPLYGRVREGVTLESIGPRREVRRLKEGIISTGFVGTGPRPRWNEVRDYLLKLTGRLPVEPWQPPELTA